MDTGASVDRPAVRPAPPADPSWPDTRGLRWHVVRGGVALGWLLLTAAVILTGERTSTLGSLFAAAADGEVHELRVTGTPLSEGGGVQTVEVRWRQGPVHHVAQLVEARPRRAALRSTGDLQPRRVVTTDAVAYVAARVPGVPVTRVGDLPSTWSQLGPWRVATWLGTGAVGLWLLTLLLVVRGPRPWRASRWAWFWPLALAPLIGVPAFLLLSGPVPGTPTARRGSRRLTGGWAFLLALVLRQLVAA